ncbi:MAG: HAD family hydrolase [Pseudomonadota bacterium]
MTTRAVFLDKDGTLIENVPYNVNPDLIRLSPFAGSALKLLSREGYALFVITNQAGVANGFFTEDALQAVHEKIRELLAEYGVDLQGFYYCPHSPTGKVKQYALHCTCRKPFAGMLYAAAREHDIDLDQSWMIGDILNDVEAGRRAGCRTILVDNGNETEWLLTGWRMPHLIAHDLRMAANVIANSSNIKMAVDSSVPFGKRG